MSEKVLEETRASLEYGGRVQSFLLFNSFNFLSEFCGPRVRLLIINNILTIIKAAHHSKHSFKEMTDSSCSRMNTNQVMEPTSAAALARVLGRLGFRSPFAAAVSIDWTSCFKPSSLRLEILIK